ncbi:hypothetical protein GW17_00016846 [Ensete ventricosum]|nr:hypothetical protein GW17_00016846 [Ensete ventricosum]
MDVSLICRRESSDAPWRRVPIAPWDGHEHSVVPLKLATKQTKLGLLSLLQARFLLYKKAKVYFLGHTVKLLRHMVHLFSADPKVCFLKNYTEVLHIVLLFRYSDTILYKVYFRLVLTHWLNFILQNDLKELWSLLNLLLPEVFDNRRAFHDWFSKPFQKDGTPHNQEDEWLETEKKVIIIHRLHRILEPFMLRRRVEDVEGSLPRKVSTL